MKDVKTCPRCNKVKPVKLFGFVKTGRHAGQPQPYCKTCATIYKRTQDHVAGRSRPLGEAKECAPYLGVYVAERALSKFFDNITRMPFGNPGYDFLCGKGFKIDVKSSCMRKGKTPARKWEFSTRRNVIADYFLCLAFDDREHLTPLHVWLIPSNVIQDKRYVSVSESAKSLGKWEKFEKSLDKVISCCGVMRNE